jgi:hypothetical protein
MKFWIVVFSFFTASVVVGSINDNVLAQKISTNIAELRNQSSELFAPEYEYYAMTALDELRIKIEVDNYKEIEEFNEKGGILAHLETLLSKTPETDRCRGGLGLLEVRYLKFKNSDSKATSEEAKSWASYIRKNYCFNTITKDEVENISKEWLIETYPEATTL